MSLTNISNRLSEYISQESSLNKEQKEVLSYSVETVLLSIAGIIMLIIVSSFFQVIIPTLIAAFFGGTLRRLSGGAHFNTPLKCLIFSTVIYTGIGVISEQLVNLQPLKLELLMIILLVLSLITVGVLAPVESKGKPIHSKTLRMKLKVFSVIFILLVLIFIMYFNFNLTIKTGAVLGIAYQGITLLPLFNDPREVIT
jgi:accessory gene regulator B